MIHRKLILFFISVLYAVSMSAEVYYISPDGNDMNDGSFVHPLGSVARAQELVAPGDTVYIRGGTYYLQESDISTVYRDLFACYAFIDKSGTPGNRILYQAYPGEQPVFDFSAVQPVNRRVVGFYITADYIHFKGIEVTGVQVTITSHTESYCFYNFGSHNIFELLSLHNNQGTGIRHRRGGYNLFLNCDAYRNHDYTSENGLGGNTDGFGCHPDDGGKGNVFRGCRAWFNSDDGYDFIGAAEVVKIEHCWALFNGYSSSFERLADGNGFKAGGDAVTPVDQLPDPIPRHVVQFCVAVRNKANGFYANHHIGGINWYNNSAYQNGTNYNMLNRLEDNETDVPGYGHRMRNNLGFAGGAELRNIDLENCDLSNNYFDLEVEVTEEDFLSLYRSALLEPRQEDGSLPEVKFMHLSRGSDLVDRGADIGFEFEGFAPDLGSFEQGYFRFPLTHSYWYQVYTPEYYWEEGNEPYYRIFGFLWEDTLIQGRSYQKIYEFSDDRLIPELAVKAGAIREDSLRRVYYRGTSLFPFPVNDTGDILLYDFGANKGDTIRQELIPGKRELIVSKVDSVMAGDQLRSRIHFSNDPYTKWIEGIGDERGMLFIAQEMLVHGLWSDLVCFWQDGEHLFHNSAFENCYETSVGTGMIRSPGMFNIYPNPVVDLAHIRFNKPFTGIIRIADVQGRTLFRSTYENITTAHLEIGTLPAGIYLVQVIDPKDSYTRLFLKRLRF